VRARFRHYRCSLAIRTTLKAIYMRRYPLARWPRRKRFSAVDGVSPSGCVVDLASIEDTPNVRPAASGGPTFEFLRQNAAGLLTRLRTCAVLCASCQREFAHWRCVAVHESLIARSTIRNLVAIGQHSGMKRLLSFCIVGTTQFCFIACVCVCTACLL
jgi:hypothetical protein